MRPTPLKRWLVGLTLLAVILFAAFLWLRPLLSIGAGYAAKHGCSCHYLQGRELEEISEHDLNFSVLGFFSLEASRDTVRSSLYGLVDRMAVHLPGRGCVLVNEADQKLPPAGKAMSPTEAMPQYSPVALNPALSAALDYGMQPVPGGGARGIVILKDGQLVGERYAPGFDRNTPLLGWSMTKTLTALLAGRLALVSRIPQAPPGVRLTSKPAQAPPPGVRLTSKPAQAPPPGVRLTSKPAQAPPPGVRLTSKPAPPQPPGVRLTSEQSNLFPDIWTDRRAEITLANLLHMSSGLAWNEGYGSLTDATVMLHERPDFAEFALHSQLIAEAGTAWNYSSGTSNIIMEYLSRQVGGNEALYKEIDALFSPIAPSLLIEPDQSGRPVGSSYGWATARDWARLGQFMLQDGVWEGDTLLPPGWVDWMREPAPASEGIYGGHLWLPGDDTPSIPDDAYMMRGFQDQRVFIIPGHDLVIARLGHGEDKVTDFDGLISRILEVYE